MVGNKTGGGHAEQTGEEVSKSTETARATGGFEERRQLERQARNRARRRKKLAKTALIVTIPVALLAFVLGRGVYHYYEERSLIDDLSADSCSFDRKTDPGASGEHINNPTYQVNPPSGGLHTVAVASEGDYSEVDATEVPPDGQLVHALEHGFIGVWFRPDIPPADLATLQALQQKRSSDILLIPRASMPAPYAATAWHERLLCQQLDVGKLERFIEFYNNKGPEKVR